MNVAILGATGYGGVQAVNLLKDNKNYKITYLGGNKASGTKWRDNFPFIDLKTDKFIEKSVFTIIYLNTYNPNLKFANREK